MTAREAAERYRHAAREVERLHRSLAVLEDQVAQQRTRLWHLVQLETEAREALLHCVEGADVPGE